MDVDWEDVFWPEVHPYVGLTSRLASLSIAYMGRSEVVEYTTDFDGGESTSIRTVWYNHNTNRMTVKFIAGGLYSYDDVSYSLFNDFQDSESLGQFFREHFRRPGHVWPGAKHNEGTTKFSQVPIERATVTADLDALKVTKLTSGKGESFLLNYTYSAEGQMEVRAKDTKQAVFLLEEYMREKGFDIKVTSVTIRL